MNRRTLGIVLALLGATVLVLVVLLLTGGTGTGRVKDVGGDTVAGVGPAPPGDPALADALDVSVSREGSDVVFTAVFAKDLPNRLSEGTVDYRWDVTEDGTPTWIVSANLNVGLNASVTAQQADFGASTVDDSLPGSVELKGDTLTIRLQVGDIEGFPETFDWSFRSSLDGDRSDPTSAIVEDTVPDSGSARLGD
ncbi:MAG: hypothetical protein ACRD1T_00100 [Acidimicrobiia bacterium]